jgi:hypothetical protein
MDFCTDYLQISHLKWYTISWNLLAWTNHYHITIYQ